MDTTNGKYNDEDEAQVQLSRDAAGEKVQVCEIVGQLCKSVLAAHKTNFASRIRCGYKSWLWFPLACDFHLAVPPACI